MRIFTYGIEDIKMDAVRWRFGKADYIDVTPQYQDILALCADIVLVAIDHTPEDIPMQRLSSFASGQQKPVEYMATDTDKFQ